MKTKYKTTRWLYLALATVALLTAGIIYGWSILKAPLAAEFGWTASALSLNFTLTMCFFCVGGILCGALIKKLGFRPVCIISAVLAGGGFFITSSMESIKILYIGYGLISGLGIGMAYTAIISSVSTWFADRKGLCSGIMMMGFGASTLVLGSIADSMINDPAMGWRAAFRVIGIALVLTLLLAGIFIRRADAPTKTGKPPEGDGLSAKEMLKTARFYKAFLFLVFLCSVGNTVISMAKDLALSVDIAPAAATTLVGVLSVCNGLGRVVTGIVFDKFGRRTTMVCASVTSVAAAALTLAAVLLSSPVLCVAGLCLTGLAYGACPTISSAYTSEVFGTRHFAMNFSIMNTNLIFASFIATGTSLITAATGAYTGAFILLLVLASAATLLNLLKGD